jgi:glycosyltransferase involved in cell wall biosynthesis
MSKLVSTLVESRFLRAERGRFPDIEIYYGPALLQSSLQSTARRVALEHGTVRWIRHGSRTDSEIRKLYAEKLKMCDHLWVTNVDDKTLEVADELMPGRWSALPHPYVFNPELPYPENVGIRRALTEATASDFLVFAPASINWLSDHDKGTRTMLESFIELRREGVEIGLILIEWGRQVKEAKNLLARAKLTDKTAWLSPLPRIPMQRTVASVDAVWDQFTYGTFGGIAFKCMEQGIPIFAHSVDARGAGLMGGHPPFCEANNVDQLLAKTRHIYQLTGELGRKEIRRRFGEPLRQRMQRHHGSELTAKIQVARYQQLLSSRDSLPDAEPDAWTKMIQSRSQSSLESP